MIIFFERIFLKNIGTDKVMLARYLTQQLNIFFPDNDLINHAAIMKYMDDVLDRISFCFRHIQAPYYNKDMIYFNHLNGDHYAMFLYIYSNTVWQIDKDEKLASKIFLLNKMLHGLDVFYNISLPNIFLFVHPVGTVIGRAKYEDYFAIYQNCTVGSSRGVYPRFYGETILFSNTSVIGECNIGKNVVFSANSFIINQNVEQDKVIIGNYPHNKIIHNSKNVIDRIFR